MYSLDGKKVLITGGTGSLGKVLLKRVLSGEMGVPSKVVIFSRDEAKQYFMRTDMLNGTNPTDDIIYKNHRESVNFIIGDIRDYHSICKAMKDIDVIVNAAAMKQVPTCEYFPHEAVRTNVEGPQNIINGIRELELPVEVVVGVSTDKACKPVNIMGMTKAIQERIFISANIDVPDTKFICVRYGNVLASRGSVIPFFHEQIMSGGPVTITTPDMTRFLLSLNKAVDTVFSALKGAKRGETFVPKVKSALIVDIADALIGDRKIEKKIIGIRPGEKIHEILISEEEAHRAVDVGDYYSILPILNELIDPVRSQKRLREEYSSADNVMSKAEVQKMIVDNELSIGEGDLRGGELLR